MCRIFPDQRRENSRGNEIAPSPHNSGHLTFGPCVTSQFEQQLQGRLRTSARFDGILSGPAAMTNLLGDVWHIGEPELDERQSRNQMLSCTFTVNRTRGRAVKWAILRLSATLRQLATRSSHVWMFETGSVARLLINSTWLAYGQKCSLGRSWWFCRKHCGGYLVAVPVRRVRSLPSFHLLHFTVNIVGCFVIGILFALSDRGNVLSPEWRVLLTTGFCGGFTTFSTFSYESLRLIQDGEYLYVAPICSLRAL